MSWNDFESEREALHYGGEMYKKEVIRYYQTKGYSLLSSSSHEGTLSDLIMKKEGEPEIHIETKATIESIFAKTSKLREEIYKYFCKWLERPKNERFEFHIFVYGLRKKEETKNILTRSAEPEKCLEWYRDNSDLKFNEQKKELLDNAKDIDIIAFLTSITVNIVSGYRLSLIVNEREKELQQNPTSQERQLLREITNRRAPIEKETTILINFLELEYPKDFWEVESKYKLKSTVYNKLNPDNTIRLPAFTIPRFESDTPVIRSFDEDLELLKPCMKGKLVQKSIDSLTFQRQRELLYEHLRRFLWCKGLRRDKSDYYFPYDEPLEKEPNQEVEAIEIESLKGHKIVTTPRYKGGRLNFVEHRSLEIILRKLDEMFGLYIWPSFIFTIDGIERISGDFASRIARKYLTPEYNRNLNKRTELRFWEYFLTKDEFVREKDSWFDNFKIKEMMQTKVRWTSESVDPDQTRMEQFWQTTEG